MAIDIRATCRCTLGPLLNASFVDEFIPERGLISTRGSCEIDAVISPSPGDTVIFQYTKDGITRTIPRRLRVMSYFSDPFRNITTVELGCKLAYLSDLEDPIDWSVYDDPLNQEEDPNENQIVVLPIAASSVANRCLEELGIQASSMPLTNRFSIPSFSFDGGYVNILSDLLVSEGYFGYLDFNEVLQIRRLDEEGTGGPVLSNQNIIDVSPLGIGQLPAESVVVSYSTLRLREPDEDDEDGQLRRNWELESNRGPLTLIEVITQDYPRTEFFGVGVTNTSINGWWSVPAGATSSGGIISGSIGSTQSNYYTQVDTFSYYPESETRTEYDNWDRVTRRTTTETSIVAAYNTEPVSQARNWKKSFPSLASDVQVPLAWADRRVTVETITTYTYRIPSSGLASDKVEGYDEVTEEVTEVYGPTAVALGGTTIRYRQGDSSLAYISGVGSGSEEDTPSPSPPNIWLPPANDRVLIERTVRRYETSGRQLKVWSVNESGERDRLQNLGNFPVSKITTSYYKLFCNTPRGQQTLSSIYEGDSLPNYEDAYFLPSAYTTTDSNAAAVVALALRMAYLGDEVQTRSGREAILDGRPGAQERAIADLANGGDPNNGYQTSSVALLELALGSAAAQRRIEFSMPYAPDDTFTRNPNGTYSSTPSDAPAKAAAYGRIQNRLLFGTRYGIGIQVPPEILPAEPMSNIYIFANGRSALYKTNGMSWTLDSTGVVAGVDALYWGQAS